MDLLKKNPPPPPKPPILGFRFIVRFSEGGELIHPQDCRFSYVSGIGFSSYSDEVHHENLVLERGLPHKSSLTSEIMQSQLNGDTLYRDIFVALLDEKGNSLKAWFFEGARLLSWTLSPFYAGSEDAVTEHIEWEYQSCRSLQQ
ncbi:MAG: phage tail protein [Bacteroidota bacterium]